MRRPQQRVLWFVALVALATGCPQCAPDRVGTGVAQLTVRNVGTMVSLVNADTNCGFASPAVQQAAVIEGAVGSAGSLTMTVNSCVMDFGELGKPLSKDCNGVASTVRGKVTISATRRVEGTLTGIPQTPIIPSSADAVTITITKAVVDNFQVRNLSSDNVLTMLDGSISAVARPHLAVSESSGACSISLPNVTFSDIKYENATVHLETPDNSFDVPVPTSDLDAQNGPYAGGENDLSGSITVFESAVTVSGDLDPNYDAERFASSYACVPDLEQPVSFQCADLRPRLAEGAARLSAKMLGTVVSLMDANNTCGFSAPTVLGAPQMTGTPGDTGSLTLTVNSCTLAFADPLTLPPDCNGVSTTVQGSVTVSGTKTVSGRFTGNPAQPIVPLTEQPAEFALEITVNPEGFRVGNTADGNALQATAGTLSGTASPRVWVGATTGVCSVSSPHIELTMDWAGADLLVSSSSGTLALNDVDSDLAATNGTVGGATNSLSGTVTVAGDSFDVPLDGEGALNPDYDAAAFDESWQCGATATALASPANSQCGAAAMRTIAGGTAALTMRTLGTVMRMVDGNTSCGFSSAAVATNPTVAGGGVGDDDVTATFDLGTGCTITLPADYLLSTDCSGNETRASGTVTVTGTKAVTGFLTGSSNPAEAIVPTSFKPAVFDLTIDFDGFVIKASNSTAYLTIHDGTLSGTVQPRTALNPATNACSIGTPNLTFSDVVWNAGEVTLTSNGSNFNATVSTSNLAAQNGTDGTQTNSLSGDITVDGVAIAGIAAPLDMAYDQTAFDATYQCAGNGNPVLVPNAACSFRQVLGNAAARLIVGSTAFATSASTGSCFDPNTTLNGTLGNPGSAVSVASACTLTVPSAAPRQPDCTTGETDAEGEVTISGTRTTTGLVVDTNSDGNADSVAPLTETGVQFTDMTYAMDAWRFEKWISGTSAGRITVTGDLAVETFIPVLAAQDNDQNDVPDGVFTKKSAIFELVDLTMSSGRAVMLLQGKTFGVDITGMNLDVVVGAYDNKVNSISGTIIVDGEPVGIAPAFDAAFSQAALDASYSCDPTLIPVPAN